MSRRKWYVVGAVAVVALALGLALGLGGGQQQSAPLAQGGLPPAGGINEGVQVHGHWTIEVRDPDGSLVSHQEFENDLASSGPWVLSEILIGHATAGPWDIALWCDPLSCSPFRDDSGNPNIGYIEEPCSTNSGSNFFYDLSRSQDDFSGKVILTGNAEAQAAGNITTVATGIWYCGQEAMPPSHWAPADCNCSTCEETPYEFTETNLSQPVQLVPGQQVMASVNISFE